MPLLALRYPQSTALVEAYHGHGPLTTHGLPLHIFHSTVHDSTSQRALGSAPFYTKEHRATTQPTARAHESARV